MEIMDMLSEHENWIEFLNYKTDKQIMSKAEIRDLTEFIQNREYENLVARLQKEYRMSTPTLKEISRSGTDRKKIIFSYNRDEEYVLKLIAYLLGKYDQLFCDNLYSFRKSIGVSKAVKDVIKQANLDKTYSYQVHIHDYFNSIEPVTILSMFKKAVPQERKLYRLLESMLLDPFAMKEVENKVIDAEGKEISEQKNGEKPGTHMQMIAVKKGVMAGVPISGFLGNLYLREIDEYFNEEHIRYIRYSDDVIVFSDDKDSIRIYESKVKEFIKKYSLAVEEDRESHFKPKDNIEFIGFKFRRDAIDVSGASLDKIENKIKRKARALYKWKIQNKADDERTMKVFVRYLNRKFYGANPVHGEITWNRWYFPILTTDESLRIIDEQAVANIRYLATGNYGKKNSKENYDDINQMGYKSLVENFWKFKDKQLDPDNGWSSENKYD